MTTKTNIFKKALILVDLQNEWIMPESDLYVGDVSDILERINWLIDHRRAQGDKIIWVLHIDPDSEGEFTAGTKNVEIISDLHHEKSDLVISKQTIGAFTNTNLEKELKGIGQISIAGILTNLCVRKLIEDAYDLDFDITVVKNCCVAMDKRTHDFTIRDLEDTREEIKFVDLGGLIKEISE